MAARLASALSRPLAIFAALVFAVLIGCSEESDVGITDPGGGGGTDCVGCHTDREALLATADPDTTTPGEDPGEG